MSGTDRRHQLLEAALEIFARKGFEGTTTKEVAAAAGVMGVVLWLVQQVLFSVPSHGMARLGALAALVVAGLLAYGLASLLFGAVDWRALLRAPAITGVRRRQS